MIYHKLMKFTWNFYFCKEDLHKLNRQNQCFNSILTKSKILLHFPFLMKLIITEFNYQVNKRLASRRNEVK